MPQELQSSDRGRIFSKKKRAQMVRDDGMWEQHVLQ